MSRTSNRAIVAVVIAIAVAVGTMGTMGAKEKRLPFGFIAPMPLVAEKPADEAVTKMIKDLGADDYRVREKAGRDLAALGEKALPDMRAALMVTENAEVQRRLAVLVRKIDHDRLVTPKKVTMSFKEKTVAQALDEISRQTGYKIDFNGRAGRVVQGGVGGNPDELKHNFEFEDTPFWVAVDKVATVAGCVVYPDYDDETIRIYNQDASNPYVAYAGPFRFLATNIHSNKSVQLSGVSRRGGNQYRQEYMNLSFQIQSEPKNPMLGVTQAQVISAVDEFGGSLAPPRDPNNRSDYYNNGRMRGYNAYGNLNLSRGDKSATTIKTLKAKVGIVLLSGTVPEITIPNPLKVKSASYTGRSVGVDFGSLVEDANNKGNFVLEVTVKKLGDNDPNRPDYTWSDTIWQKIELIDENGGRYHSFGPNTLNNNGTTVQMTLPFRPQDRRGNAPKNKLGPPARLVINEWLSVTHEVTFEFKDIPLP